MSNTPRTDAATHGFVGGSGKDIWNIEYVDASFAQQLELELADAERKLKEIETRCKEQNQYFGDHDPLVDEIIAIVRGK